MEKNSVREIYEASIRKKWVLFFCVFLASVLLGLYFMTIGVAQTSMWQVVKAIVAWISGTISASPDSADYKIIVLMRLPRIVMAAVAGAGMAIAGTSMQAVTRNPLVSPFTVGVSSAAAFGASMCIVFAENAFFKSEAGIVSCAFLSALLCITVVYAVSAKAGMSAETVVLAGIALNYFFNALTATVEFFAQEHKLAAVVQWTFGTFNGITWSEVLVAMFFVFICIGIISLHCQKLDIMISGDDETAKSLGVHPEKVRLTVSVVSVLMTSAIISFTGVIGFVGLVAPHIARLIVGGDHKFLLPYSALCGAS